MVPVQKPSMDWLRQVFAHVSSTYIPVRWRETHIHIVLGVGHGYLSKLQRAPQISIDFIENQIPICAHTNYRFSEHQKSSDPMYPTTLCCNTFLHHALIRSYLRPPSRARCLLSLSQMHCSFQTRHHPRS